ncbi:MAG: 50S ribosomal protein L11 methyltransferase [Anaerolineales bacterium]|nr:50S ribosomal protein L11 methyltransferase [Anaerolineales bacterium]
MAEAAWLQVTVEVDGEMAEAVADVFSRYAPNGVVIESTQIKAAPNEPGEPVGPLRVVAYLPVDGRLEETRQKLLEGLWHMGQIQPIPEPTFTPIQETNWMEAWKSHYKPIAVGKRLLITPTWIEPQAKGRIPIRMEPGMAFGTGTHPTTQLALELLEKWLEGGQAVIDVGCGSGILSIAAAKLGAAPILGVDIDAKAIQVAEANNALNPGDYQPEFYPGSVAEIREGKYALRTAPLVITNILAHILIKLLDAGMGDLVSENGILILSGILEEKETEITSKLTQTGFEVIDRIQQKDWVAFAARRTATP